MNAILKASAVALTAGLAALALAAAKAESRGDRDDDDEDEVELEVARVFIEWNSTDEDFGIQFFWDGVPWSEMTIEDGSGREALSVKPKRSLRRHGLTEGFFESAEPGDVSMEEFFRRFPEGTYEFEGRTLDGRELEGEAEFTHALPAPPENLSPAEGDEVDPDGFAVSFDEVSEDIHGNPIEIAYYEVIVEKEDDEPILQTFRVILRPSVTSVGIPAAFLEPGTEYKFEVIAVSEAGNKTITESGIFSTTD